MKKSGPGLKHSSLTFRDLKPLSKLELKSTSSNRVIDTKLLFKSEQEKELAKFSLNIQSRDISYLRDKFSHLPKLPAALPTDFQDLKQLYYSSDHFGMPISISSQNITSSHTCKKKTCIENALITHNSSVITTEDFNPDSFDRISLGNPTGRQDIKHLQTWLGLMKETLLDNLKVGNETWTPDLIEKAEIVFVMAGKEIIRQVSVHCIERGEVLKEILWFFSNLHRYQQTAFQKELQQIDKMKHENEERLYKHTRQIAQYEISLKLKSDKIHALKNAKAELESSLKDAQSKLQSLQGKNHNEEFKGYIFNSKQMSPTIHRSNSKGQIKNDTIRLVKLELDSTFPSDSKEPVSEQIENSDSQSISIVRKITIPEGEEADAIIERENEDDLDINEKVTQTEFSAAEIMNAITQTENIYKPQQYHFDFRPRIGNEFKSISKSPLLKIDNLQSISVVPGLSIALPENLSLQLKVSQKPRSESLLVINSSDIQGIDPKLLESVNLAKIVGSDKAKLLLNNAAMLKRHSVLSPTLSKLTEKVGFASESVSPDLDKSSLESHRKQSKSFISPFEPPKDDILLMNIITKQKAIEELSSSVKIKKTEVNTLNTEIEQKNQALGMIKREMQLKYLELQAISKPSEKNILEYKKQFIEKLDDIKEEKDVKVKKNSVLLDVNGISVEIEARLEELVPNSLDIISWKAGFNVGFEKGLSVGLTEGEQLGIEVGSEQGLAKKIIEIVKGITHESQSDSSSEASIDVIEDTGNPHTLESPTEIEKIVSGTTNSEKTLKNIKGIEINRRENSELPNQVYIEKTINPKQRENKIIKIEKAFKAEKPSKSEKLIRTIAPEIEEKKIVSLEKLSDILEINKNQPRQGYTGRKSSMIVTSDMNIEKLPQKRGSIMPSQSEQILQQAALIGKSQIVSKKPGEDNNKPKEIANQSHIARKSEDLKGSMNKDLYQINIHTDSHDYSSKFSYPIVESKGNRLKEFDASQLDKVNSDRTSEKYVKQVSQIEKDIDKNEAEEKKEMENENNEQEKNVYSRQRKETQFNLRKRIKDITKVSEFHFHRNTHTSHKKLHFAPKLIEEFLKKKTERIIRKSKMGKRMVYRTLNLFYQSYISKLKSGEIPLGLIEHSYEELLQKYSLKTVSDKKMIEFIGSLIKFSSCKRALMFLRLAGLSDKLKIEGYSSYSVNFYMKALNFMMSSKIGIVIAMDETADRVMVPVVRATECVKELFEGKLDRLSIGKLVTKLEIAAVKDPKKINQGGLIENELSLELMLEFYEAYQKNVTEGAALAINIMKYKEDPSSILKSELGMMVRNISPSKYKEADYDDGLLTNDELLLRCLDKNLLNIEEINAFIIKEEKLIGDKDFMSDKLLMQEEVLKMDKKYRGLDPNLWQLKIQNLLDGYYTRDILESFIAWRIYYLELFSSY